MKKLVLSIALVLIASLTLSAQGLTPYTWKQYGLSFKVPGGANILQNTSTAFEVDNDMYNVKIHVYDAENATADDISNFLLTEATSQGMKTGEAEVQTFSNTGVQGLSIEGTRGVDHMCVALILSETSHIVIAVSVVYADGMHDEANDLINSFTMK